MALTKKKKAELKRKVKRIRAIKARQEARIEKAYRKKFNRLMRTYGIGG